MAEIQVNSKDVIPGLNRLARGFWDFLKKQPGGGFLEFDPSQIDNIAKEYPYRLNDAKEYIFGSSKNEELIDQHKIIALYLELVVKYPFFTFSPPNNSRFGVDYSASPVVLNAHENFCWLAIWAMLSSWCHRPLVPLSVRYRSAFLKLIHQYRKGSAKYDFFTWAHLVFFIEKSVTPPAA
jgi:hypothetical protein